MKACFSFPLNVPPSQVLTTDCDKKLGSNSHFDEHQSSRTLLRLRYRSFTTPRKRIRCSLTASASINGYTTVLIVPTGIGASVGGYAGDALPSARLLASVSDTLVTHPNVLNGALMYWPIANALYVEGFALDQFCCGTVNLQPIRHQSNKIGLLLDAGMSEEAKLRHLQAADAARATLGLRVVRHVVTEEPIAVSYAKSPSGASWGTIGRPDTLLSAATRLRDDDCDAIAVVAEFPEEEGSQLANYRAGNAVDGISGAEAVISHLVTKHLQVPCAHAPSLPPLDVDDSVSPKAAAEELGYTFLTCVLVGLSRAPRLVSPSPIADYNSLSSVDVNAVVVPASAFGSASVMSLATRRDTLIVAVKDNKTALNVPPSAVGIESNRVTTASSYAEAAGFIAAHKAGIDLRSLTSYVPSLISQKP